MTCSFIFRFPDCIVVAFIATSIKQLPLNDSGEIIRSSGTGEVIRSSNGSNQK